MWEASSMSAISAESLNQCCQQLAAALPSKVSYSGNSTYASVQSDYWSLTESTLSPSCIVVPLDAQDVSVAVSILTSTNTDECYCPFAVKGGGHSPNAGFANIQNGITIDMDQLNAVTLNSDASVASIGAGATWLQVYEYLDGLDLDVAVAGGRNGAVGVGGLLIGGGISYFGARVGWACDNVVNFEIVLASGEIANANRTANPDLWRALKGGAGNFGIVTRFDLATFKQGGIWGGQLGQDISSRQEVFEDFANIANAPQYDPYASIVSGFTYVAGQWSISHLMTYTKEVDAPPPVYQPLLSIQPQTQNTLKNTTLSALTNEAATPPFNIAFQTGTYGVDVELLNEIFDINNATLYELSPKVNGTLIWSIAYEPLPAIWMQYGDLKGGNSLGTSPRDGNAFVVLVTALWSDTSASDLVQTAARDITQKVDSIAQSKGLKHEFLYLNYANANQNALASYGQENLYFLKEVAKKYDPRRVFQTQEPGGFKVSKS